jgi:hypothetical protein
MQISFLGIKLPSTLFRDLSPRAALPPLPMCLRQKVPRSCNVATIDILKLSKKKFLPV